MRRGGLAGPGTSGPFVAEKEEESQPHIRRYSSTRGRVDETFNDSVGSRKMIRHAKFVTLIAVLLVSGCASPKVLQPVPANALRLVPEPRRVPQSTPYTVLCNVLLQYFNNSGIPADDRGTVTFYAEQNGVFYPLREIEEPGGRRSAPYHPMWAVSVTLPRPPLSGPCCIFAVVNPAHGKDDTRPEREKIISTPIFVTFAELDASAQKSAESVVQGILDAGQYRQEFKQGTRDDPTSR